jgi:DNA-binding NtrC family response regulator
MPNPRILLVDDSADTLEVLQRNLAGRGYEVEAVLSASEAVQALATKAVDIVVTDLKMPGMSGLDLVRHVRENYKDTEVLMITGYPSVEGAVEAVKSGAHDFLAKPFTAAELRSAVQNALTKLEARRAAGRRAVDAAVARAGLLGESGGMRRVFQAIARVAPTAAPVLLVGEVGTGKELIARAIHYCSTCASENFVPINVAGFPPDRLEADLFGTVGAGGLLASARGTVFLDGVGALAPALQTRLARAFEQKSTSAPLPRIVSSTTKDLLAQMRGGELREDLFYRLSVVTLEVPALRKRGDDVLLLAQHFASRFAAEASHGAPRLSDQLLNVLKCYDWPGNVLELENVMQRLVVMGNETLDVPDLPSLMRFSGVRERGLRRPLAEVEAEHIRAVLDLVDGNRSAAAKILGIDRKTLREKMRRSDGHED